MASNYPNGFKSGLTVMGVPVAQGVGGNVFWVNSTGGADAAGQPGTRDRPFATLDYAVGRCSANNGDVIYVAPNHSETNTGASAITFDVAGVTVIGLGVAGQRPTFLLDAGTAVTWVVSAADVKLKNLVLVAGHDGIVTAIDVAATNVTLEGLEFRQNTTAEHFLTAIKVTSTTDNAADGLKIIACRIYAFDTGFLEAIEINGNIADLVVSDNIFYTLGTACPLILLASGKIFTGAVVTRNMTQCANTTIIWISCDGTTSTGIVDGNLVSHLDTSGELLFTGTVGLHSGVNYASGVITASGYLLPAVYNDA